MATHKSLSPIRPAPSDNRQLASAAQQLQTMQLEDRPTAPSPRQPITIEYCKDGKLCYTESKLLAENHPFIHQRIAEFRVHRQQFEAAHAASTVTPTFEYPRDYIDLIAALTQDSEESISQLSHRINDVLSPFSRNERFTEIFTESIERGIKSCASRAKYGLSPRVLTQLEGGPTMIPHHLSISRWEASDISCLPLDLQAVINHRRHLRSQMSDVITAAFQTLSAEQQLALLHTKHRKSQVVDDIKTKEEIELENERRRKKEEEKRIREEEKRKREEEKRAREEERKKREDERRRREEEKKRKEQATPEDKLHTNATLGAELTKTNPSMFPPFYVKEHVSIHRWPGQNVHSPDFYAQLTAYSTNETTPVPVSKDLQQQFLHDLRSRVPKEMQKRGITKSIDLRSALLGPNISEDAFSHQALRMKLLQFCEDVRPAYYGTWTKKSNAVTACNPFGQDHDHIDYEHDSEAEWEPEGEGEEIQSGDEDDEDVSADVMDPDDSNWLVPEGYLSEGEGVDSDDELSGKVASRPIVRPAKKYTAIRPVAIGPIFDDSDDSEDDTLKQYEVRMLGDVSTPYNPLLLPEDMDITSTPGNSDESTKKAKFTEEQATELMQIIEVGKNDGMTKLISEAKSNKLLQSLPKRQIEMKIKDMAIKEKRGSDTKPSWYMKGANA
ncbi:hypothetical protein RO3G_06701 [Lichtheimia corymbifera JMRC:FSU:9682]|uniref:Uncharacterized protein n=1 Tax=Lichtheimia corymbifera JMRC:FSU:9682 TaxID=1263082 RepID=A0A068RRG0_9FUNG|nr:hypothetical protein RO3G_06701 [Lichtheimia corymbifera JMRC:FSU:9682]